MRASAVLRVRQQTPQTTSIQQDDDQRGARRSTSSPGSPIGTSKPKDDGQTLSPRTSACAAAPTSSSTLDGGGGDDNGGSPRNMDKGGALSEVVVVRPSTAPMHSDGKVAMRPLGTGLNGDPPSVVFEPGFSRLRTRRVMLDRLVVWVPYRVFFFTFCIDHLNSPVQLTCYTQQNLRPIHTYTYTIGIYIHAQYNVHWYDVWNYLHRSISLITVVVVLRAFICKSVAD